MTGTCKTFTKNYTMVEILVVLSIVGILLGISLGGINSMLKRQGASGAVRNISSQLSLARSYAVMKNSYIALLFPNDNPTPPGASFAFTTGFTVPDLKQFFFYSKSRLCIVTPSATTGGVYTFSSWIDGNEWNELPSGSCAYISNKPIKVDGLKIDFNGVSYTPVTTPAIVFKPSGVLVGGSDVTVTAFMGRFIATNPAGKELVYETKSGQNNAWKITVNPFTGRSSYEKKTGN